MTLVGFEADDFTALLTFGVILYRSRPPLGLKIMPSLPAATAVTYDEPSLFREQKMMEE